MTKKKTQEEFINEVNNMFPNNEFTVLGEYKTNRNKILIRHNLCNEEFEVYPNDFLKKRYSSCKICKQKEKLFNKLHSYLSENNLLDEYLYENNQNILFQYEKLTFKHSVCGCVFNKELDSFYQGKHCPFCAGMRTDKTFAQYKIDKITSKGEFIITNNENEIIDSNASKVRLLHTTCKRETVTTLNYFISQNSKCYHCTKETLSFNKRKSNEFFVKELNEMYSGDYIPLEDYTTAQTYMKFIHVPCGEVLNLRPNSLLSKNGGCKTCSMSTPESIINNILMENKINYKFGYKFNDCISDKNKKLPFDFVIFENDNHKYIIEYDGQHHFHENAFGKESYERTIKNDLIKNKYCDDNDIKIYRIPYTELKNLEKIVLTIINNSIQ